eukprot:1158133-Pelagomonas_calceolata.AAC.8
MLGSCNTEVKNAHGGIAVGKTCVLCNGHPRAVSAALSPPSELGRLCVMKWKPLSSVCCPFVSKQLPSCGIPLREKCSRRNCALPQCVFCQVSSPQLARQKDALVSRVLHVQVQQVDDVLPQAASLLSN